MVFQISLGKQLPYTSRILCPYAGIFSNSVIAATIMAEQQIEVFPVQLLDKCLLNLLAYVIVGDDSCPAPFLKPKAWSKFC